MSEQSPLAGPHAWNAVAEGYADEFLPLFSLYARDALALARVPEGGQVLDVAAGPGTLSLLVAEVAAKVVAVDFADTMVDISRRRISEAGVANVEVQRADGQALPFADAAFDAAFSLFGLMFFPDRAAGFHELHRVLKPGGRAVVSSWAPIGGVRLLAAMFESLAAEFPELPFGDAPPPLADPDVFEAEMRSAGFAEVTLHSVTHQVEVPSVQIFWETQQKASAPVVLLRNQVSDARWREVSQRVKDQLVSEFGDGPVGLAWPANVGVGVRGK